MPTYIHNDDPRLLGAIDVVAMAAEVGDLYSSAPWAAWKRASLSACRDAGLPDRLAGMIASKARLLWIARVHHCHSQEA